MPRPFSTSAVLDDVGDLLSDLAIWGLATWTVLYHVGRAVGVGTTPVLLASVAVTLALSVTTWRHVSRLPPTARAAPASAATVATPTTPTRHAAAAGTPSAAQPRPRFAAPALWVLFAVSVALALAAVLVHWPENKSTYRLGWLLMAAALVPLVWSLVAARGGAEATVSEADPPAAKAPGEPGGSSSRSSWLRAAASATVWAVAAVLAYLSLRTVRLDADDVFYVNKAVYVAETGRIPTRDTIYSDQLLPALRGAGTAPVQSLEVLQGAVAHLLGISAGTVVYLVTPAVMSVLAVWAVWRLARTWSVVRALVAFAVATTYLLWGAKSGYGLGAFWIGRIWQGKVIFVCLALPLLYLALTRSARLGRRYDAAMLFAVGAVAVGLTSTATLVVPPIAAGAAVMLVLCRRRRWYVPLLAAAYPVASGVVVALSAAGGGQFGRVAFTSFEAFHAVVGEHLWGALGVVALLLAPWAARAGAARMTATAGSAVAVAAMAPGVPQLVNTVTGAGPILYRLMWIAVLPVLVGLLATAPLPADRFAPAVRRTVAVAVPAATAVLLVVGGQLVWSQATTLQDGPRWKFPTQQLAAAQWVGDVYDGPGPVLAPWRLMRALALTTTEIHAVDPRVFYLSALDESPRAHAARVRLSRSMRNGNTTPPPTLADDLAAVGVGLVCLDEPKVRYAEAVLDLGWQPVATRGSVTCFTESG
ncbi:MAG: DUF6077 domain-containing protein [Ornithinibacter sp.]